jgi:glucokinase
MFLGIEIGGTKLQFGVGTGRDAALVDLARRDVDPKGGAEGIRRQIAEAARPLIARHQVRGIGIGFGGPVDGVRGRTIVSHQVEGWKDFPLSQWCVENLGMPAVLANDSDSAGLAEARFGAGRGFSVVVYNNIGSGIGGALVIDGHLYPGSCGVAAEIGHLRLGPEAERSDQVLESVASGWAISRNAVARLQQANVEPKDRDDLLARCGGQVERLNTKMLAEAACSGNALARASFDTACRAIGWALGQVITLVAPNVIVMGGGVSLVGEDLFLRPLREYVDRYAFPPLRGTYQIVPAKLGEEMVVHGVLALAAQRESANET